MHLVLIQYNGGAGGGGADGNLCWSRIKLSCQLNKVSLVAEVVDLNHLEVAAAAATCSVKRNIDTW